MLGLAIGGQKAFSAKHGQLRFEAAVKNYKKIRFFFHLLIMYIFFREIVCLAVFNFFPSSKIDF